VLGGNWRELLRGREGTGGSWKELEERELMPKKASKGKQKSDALKARINWSAMRSHELHTIVYKYVFIYVYTYTS
jgi:hypothetical protein